MRLDYLPGMVVRTCGYCGKGVDLDAGPHVHDPKTCGSCRRTLPATSFPIHKSACDGRRLDCADCCATQHQANVAKQRDSREQQKAADRAALKEHGYVWQRRRTGWVLLDPAGRPTDRSAALAEIDRKILEADWAREADMGFEVDPW